MPGSSPRYLLFLLAAASITCPAAAGRGAGDPAQYEALKGRYEGRASIHEPFYVVEEESGKRLRGLFLSVSAPAGQVNRALVETPDDGRLILTSTLDARAGIATVRLEDDATQWWVETRADFRAPSEDLDDFLARALSEMAPGPYPGMLRTKGAITVEARSETQEQLPEALHAALRAAELEQSLADAVPAGLREDVLFLASIPRPEIGVGGRDALAYWRGLLWILSQSLHNAGLAAPAPEPTQQPLLVSADPDQREKGLAVHEPELLEFVATFRTLENTSPLPEREFTALLEPAPERWAPPR